MAVRKKAKKDTAIVVLTKGKEIFFGHTDCDPTDDVLELKNACQAIYYSSATGGLLGLGARGPAIGSRLGPVCKRVVVREPLNVLLASERAVAAWEKDWS